MDFLNKTFAQVAELFRSLTPGMRVTTGLLLVSIIISLAFLFRFSGTEPDYYLFGGRILTDREISLLQAAFSQASLNDWDTTGNRIRVPHHKRAQYIAAAAEGNSLPEDFDTILEQMISTSSPFEPKEMRDMKQVLVIQRHLTMIVEAMHGIDRATVKINEERQSGFNRNARKTAVVAVQAEGNNQLTSEQVQAIRMTVAKGVGAALTDVVVQDLMGPAYPGQNTDGTPTSMENVYIATKQKTESHYRDKIMTALSMVPGVIVGVNVELDPRLNQTTHTQTFNQPQAVRSSNSIRKETNRNESAGGRAGAVPNGVVANRAEEVAATATASTGGNESVLNESQEDTESVIGSETTRIETLGLIEKTVNATISVPQSYFRRIWLKDNPGKNLDQLTDADKAEIIRIETEELKRIEESIQRLIPQVSGGQDPWPRVIVRTYVDLKTPAPPEPTTLHNLTSWLTTNWRTLGLVALASVALLMVRSMAKSAQKLSAAPVAPLPENLLPETNREEQEETSPALQHATRMLKRKAAGAGPNLREELSELVREDPDAAATILSNWIGDAV